MVYIHVPFCRSFCTYCDFYSEIACRGRGEEQLRRYADSLLEEIEMRAGEIQDSKSVKTLYIGGGTPSVLPLDILSEIINALPAEEYEEFTIEVNPEDIVEKGMTYLTGLLGLGIGRVSMGVQSLDDGMLKWMNRRHDAATARKAYTMIREAGFRNVSVDMIYGVSGMTSCMLAKTLEEMTEIWHPEHISAYQLSVEEGSTLGQLNYRELDDDSCREHYEAVCSALGEAGYRHYEISNWAVPGFEAVHNSAYWRRVPYVGLGPAAHSLRIKDGKQIRSWNSSELCGWSPESEILTEEEIREETLMLGLRTAEGIDGKVIQEKDWFIADTIIKELI